MVLAPETGGVPVPKYGLTCPHRYRWSGGWTSKEDSNPSWVTTFQSSVGRPVCDLPEESPADDLGAAHWCWVPQPRLAPHHGRAPCPRHQVPVSPVSPGEEGRAQSPTLAQCQAGRQPGLPGVQQTPHRPWWRSRRGSRPAQHPWPTQDQTSAARSVLASVAIKV